MTKSTTTLTSGPSEQSVPLDDVRLFFRAAYLAGRISALRGGPVSEAVEKPAAVAAQGELVGGVL